MMKDVLMYQQEVSETGNSLDKTFFDVRIFHSQCPLHVRHKYQIIGSLQQT